MSAAINQDFHNQARSAERHRVLLRISQGTKAGSPDIRIIRRSNPLNFSNPLPDNSSGSKIRPFDAAKDESGRPNAMEIVAMNQRKRIQGGVTSREASSGISRAFRNKYSDWASRVISLLGSERLNEFYDLFDDRSLTEDDIKNFFRLTVREISPELLAETFGNDLQNLQPELRNEIMNAFNTLSGGVLKDYRYARDILGRRARDTTNIELESQGLPPMASPIAELSAIDSKSLELNTLLQNIQASIEESSVSSEGLSQLTISELKGLPRLLIQLVPTYTPQEATELIQFIDDDILEVLRDYQPQTKQVIRIRNYFDAVRNFLEEVMPFLGLDDRTKQRASLQIGKRIFGKQLVQSTEAPIQTREAVSTPIRQEAQAQEQVQAQREETPIGASELDELKQAYRTNDVERLSRFVRDNYPNIRAEKHFKSRTTLANLIELKKGVNIKR